METYDFGVLLYRMWLCNSFSPNMEMYFHGIMFHYDAIMKFLNFFLPVFEMMILFLPPFAVSTGGSSQKVLPLTALGCLNKLVNTSPKKCSICKVKIFKN